MRQIHLFIATSSEALKTDMMELGLLFNRLNNCYINKDLYFALEMNAGISGADGGKQKMAGSSAAFFILSEDTGSDISELYKAARDSYNRTGSPIIAIYVKNSGNDAPDSDRLLRDKLGDDAELRSNAYSHIDTLKLGILMQIKQLDLPGVDIRLEDGNAWQDGNMLMPLENVESVTGFEDLQALKHKRAQFESLYYAAKARYAENPGDAAAHDEYIEASKKRSGVIGEIREIESQLYSLVEGMYEHTAQGKLSKRQTEGYKLIGRGLLSEARDVLDYFAIINECRHDEEQVGKAAQRASIHINELMQLKDVNAALHDLEGVDDCFSEAVRLEEKHNLYRKSSLAYVKHLVRQLKYKDALNLGESLLRYYESLDPAQTAADRATLCNYLGELYYSIQRIEESEKMLKTALALWTILIEETPGCGSMEIAQCYSLLGNMYSEAGRYPEAIETLNSALEIATGLNDNNSSEHEEYIAVINLNLGNTYCEAEKYAQSTEYTAKALDILKKLVATKPEPIETYLAICYGNLGLACMELQRSDEAEGHFLAALEILNRNAETDPGAFEPRIANTYYCLGKLYAKSKRYAEAEEKLHASLSLFNKYSAAIPALDTFSAECLYNAGELYGKTGRPAEAEKAYNAALQIYEKHKESNPLFATKAAETKKRLNSIRLMQPTDDNKYALLTPDEREIALLLIEGENSREISRKLHIGAEEIGRIQKTIREKVVSMAGSNSMIGAASAEYKLTRREADMLRCLRHDESTAEIAAELFLSEETVRVHIRSLLKKLSLENRSDVASWLEGYTAKV